MIQNNSPPIHRPNIAKQHKYKQYKWYLAQTFCNKKTHSCHCGYLCHFYMSTSSMVDHLHVVKASSIFGIPYLHYVPLMLFVVRQGYCFHSGSNHRVSEWNCSTPGYSTTANDLRISIIVGRQQRTCSWAEDFCVVIYMHIREHIHLHQFLFIIDNDVNIGLDN